MSVVRVGDRVRSKSTGVVGVVVDVPARDSYAWAVRHLPKPCLVRVDGDTSGHLAAVYPHDLEPVGEGG